MNKEIDIIELIKSRRFLKIAIKKLLSDQFRMKLKQRSRYECIDPDKEQGSQPANSPALMRVFTHHISKFKSEENEAKKAPTEEAVDHTIFNLTDGFFSSSSSDSSSGSESS